MKKAKKLLALLLTGLMVFAMTACGSGSGNGGSGSDNESDMEYVKDKGTLVVGITNFEPMDYQDDNGEWIGFDADLAKAFGESLGVDVEFVEIEWGSKIMELDGKTIDCVWNGMTLTDEVTSSMECTQPYCRNAQIVVLPTDVADQYTTTDSLKNLNFAVEDGSAGQEAAEELGVNYTPVQQQSDALMEVASGTCDAAIIDSLMAAAMVGEGTGYANLTYTLELTSEEYGASKAVRPKNSRMSKDKLEQAGFHRLPAWQDALTRFLKNVGEYHPVEQ